MKLTESEISAPVAKELRRQAGMTQPEFWKPLGVHQAVASKYEAGVSKIPRSVRILVVATHVAGLKIQTQTPEDVAALAKLAALQVNFKAASALARKATRELDSASKDIGEARATLANI